MIPLFLTVFGAAVNLMLYLDGGSTWHLAFAAVCFTLTLVVLLCMAALAAEGL